MIRPVLLALLALLAAAGPARANALGDRVPRPLVPKALHGVFGTDPAACRDRDSDGRMEVTATGIRFCESTARPDRLIELPGGAVAIWADFAGEGESWGELLGLEPTAQGVSRLTASDGHRRQARVADVRCPAGRR